MMLKLFVGLFGLLVVSTNAWSQIPHLIPPNTSDSWHFATGNDLLDQCGADSETPNLACAAYVRGAIDMIGSLQGSIASDDKKTFWKARSICLPNEVTTGQVKDVVVKYMRANPETRADNAAWIIIRALIQAWGCPPAN
jgi:Rap1a immunity proteins